MKDMINGVSFEEYVCASAHLTSGMQEDQVCNVLEMEKPELDKTLKKWNEKLSHFLSADPMNSQLFAEIFAKPYFGRFSKIKSEDSLLEQALKLVPVVEDYERIRTHITVANKYGFDSADILKLYKLNVGLWGVVNVHYGAKYIDSIGDDYLAELERHFEERYKHNKIDLGKKIIF